MDTRPMQWSDVAILLRSPKDKGQVFAREFARAGIPLVVPGGDCFAGTEISDLLHLFRILDNPVQDVPLLAVLGSPSRGAVPMSWLPSAPPGKVRSGRRCNGTPKVGSRARHACSNSSFATPAGAGSRASSA